MGETPLPSGTYHCFPRVHQQLVRKGILDPALATVLGPPFGQEANLGWSDRVSERREE